MNHKVSEQIYFRMAKLFYEHRVIGVPGLLLCFGNVYIVIAEGLYCIHRRADNDNETTRY